MAIGCECCGDAVYPHEDDALSKVKYWIEHEEIRTIDDLRSRASKTCNACVHMLDKGD
jgi:hypothetical protein